jgi:hypothetical protein
VDPTTNESSIKTYSFVDKLMWHMVGSAEILITKNFHARVGYNFQRRYELGVESSSGTVGLCWGFGIKISKFNISYGRAAYHLAGSADHFSISTNLSDFTSK